LVDRKTETKLGASVNQRDRFIEAARDLGADEDETAFKARLATIVRQRPAPELPTEKPKRKARKEP
jgi:hypothetical protein